MAKLIAFPLCHLTGRARHVAAMIHNRADRSRDAYLQTVCRQMADRLRRNGLPDNVVQMQIGRFVAAVEKCVDEGWHFNPAPSESGELLEDQHPGGAA